jgi:Icc-related predicted phosphoesterase
MKNKLRITFISDTHSKHKQVTSSLPGGDLLIHAGDISSMGYQHEIREFCSWFDKLNNYDHKVFIAGNHDWGFQDNTEKIMEIINSYKGIDYLQDDMFMFRKTDNDEDMIKIWGSPWQPEFCNWAFNLPRRGEELKKKWDLIPTDVDILVTHGPAYGYVDRVIGRPENLGCELLSGTIKDKKPKIHVCGHIHSGYGYIFDGDTHYINAAVLNEQYAFAHNPLTVDWDPETNQIEFLD